LKGLAPFAHPRERRLDRLAECGERILDARRRFGKDLARDDVIALDRAPHLVEAVLAFDDGMDSSRSLFGIMVPAEALGGFSTIERRSPR
jgi:hypothetical protein